MDAMRGTGGIQMLLSAEQEAQQIITGAKNKKLARLRQAKVEAESEIAQYRGHLEAEYQQSISEKAGNSDFTVKRLETDTETKILNLKESASRNSSEVVAKLVNYIAAAKI